MESSSLDFKWARSTTLIEASAYINPFRKKFSTGQNYIWQFNNTSIESILKCLISHDL